MEWVTRWDDIASDESSVIDNRLSTNHEKLDIVV